MPVLYTRGDGQWGRIATPPKGLLPFGLDELALRAKMTDWLGSLWFAPVARLRRKGRQMSGIYVPYWTFTPTPKPYLGQRGNAALLRDPHRHTRRQNRTGTGTETRWVSA
jgi:hypothetical protein